jgi:hypothetical protein
MPIVNVPSGLTKRQRDRWARVRRAHEALVEQVEQAAVDHVVFREPLINECARLLCERLAKLLQPLEEATAAEGELPVESVESVEPPPVEVAPVEDVPVEDEP